MVSTLMHVDQTNKSIYLAKLVSLSLIIFLINQASSCEADVRNEILTWSRFEKSFGIDQYRLTRISGVKKKHVRMDNAKLKYAEQLVFVHRLEAESSPANDTITVSSKNIDSKHSSELHSISSNSIKSSRNHNYSPHSLPRLLRNLETLTESNSHFDLDPALESNLVGIILPAFEMHLNSVASNLSYEVLEMLFDVTDKLVLETVNHFQNFVTNIQITSAVLSQQVLQGEKKLIVKIRKTAFVRYPLEADTVVIKKLLELAIQSLFDTPELEKTKIVDNLKKIIPIELGTLSSVSFHSFSEKKKPDEQSNKLLEQAGIGVGGVFLFFFIAAAMGMFAKNKQNLKTTNTAYFPDHDEGDTVSNLSRLNKGHRKKSNSMAPSKAYSGPGNAISPRSNVGSPEPCQFSSPMQKNGNKSSSALSPQSTISSKFSSSSKHNWQQIEYHGRNFLNEISLCDEKEGNPSKKCIWPERQTEIDKKYTAADDRILDEYFGDIILARKMQQREAFGKIKSAVPKVVSPIRSKDRNKIEGESTPISKLASDNICRPSEDHLIGTSRVPILYSSMPSDIFEIDLNDDQQESKQSIDVLRKANSSESVTSLNSRIEPKKSLISSLRVNSPERSTSASCRSERTKSSEAKGKLKDTSNVVDALYQKGLLINQSPQIVSTPPNFLSNFRRAFSSLPGGHKAKSNSDDAGFSKRQYSFDPQIPPTKSSWDASNMSLNQTSVTSFKIEQPSSTIQDTTPKRRNDSSIFNRQKDKEQEIPPFKKIDPANLAGLYTMDETSGLKALDAQKSKQVLLSFFKKKSKQNNENDSQRMSLTGSIEKYMEQKGQEDSSSYGLRKETDQSEKIVPREFDLSNQMSHNIVSPLEKEISISTQQGDPERGTHIERYISSYTKNEEWEVSELDESFASSLYSNANFDILLQTPAEVIYNTMVDFAEDVERATTTKADRFFRRMNTFADEMEKNLFLE